MFSQTANYAWGAARCIAQNPGQLLTAAAIATQTRIPHGYLSKILQSLARAGLIKATRGLHGGYQLTRSAEMISILQVINAVDPLKRIRACPLKLPAYSHQLCPFHCRIDQALGEIENYMASTTLAQVLSEPTSSVSFCPVSSSHQEIKRKR
jgi:Rrf2 family transcriptional regulator, nitric oxide-sensitive transcriptional repressor